MQTGLGWTVLRMEKGRKRNLPPWRFNHRLRRRDKLSRDARYWQAVNVVTAQVRPVLAGHALRWRTNNAPPQVNSGTTSTKNMIHATHSNGTPSTADPPTMAAIRRRRR